LASLREQALRVAIDRPQGGYAREFDGVTMFGSIRQKLGRHQDSRHVVVTFWEGVAEMRDNFPQGSKLDTAGQNDGFGKRRGQDTTQRAREPGFKPRFTVSFRQNRHKATNFDPVSVGSSQTTEWGKALPRSVGRVPSLDEMTQSEIEARVLRDLAHSRVRIANQIDRYIDFVKSSRSALANNGFPQNPFRAGKSARPTN